MNRPVSISALFAFILIGWFGSSCTDEGICRRGNGTQVTDTLSFAAFSSIEVAENADVTIVQGNTQEVIFTGDENVMEALDARVENGSLIIDLDGCFTMYDLDVAITLPASQPLENLVVSGAGTIVSSGKLAASTDLDLVVSGAGSIDLDTDATTVKTVISGAGDVDLDGSATTHELTISGSGDLTAFDFPTDDVTITISGSGQADVTVNNSLVAEISGSGSVFYKGNPTLTETISGSGKIVDAN